jgi:hypothetical protein
MPEEQNVLSVEELELQEAQKRLADAKAKKALADGAKLAAAREALAKQKAQIELERFEEQERAKIVQAEWAAKKQAEEQAKIAAQRLVDQAQRALESRIIAEEQKQQEREAHAREVQRLSDEAFRLEQAAAQELASTLRMSAPDMQEPTINLHSEGHPLAFLFKDQERPVTASPAAPEPTVLAPSRRKIRENEVQKINAAFIKEGIQAIQLFHITDLLYRYEPSQIEEALNYALQVAGSYALKRRDLSAVLQAMEQFLTPKPAQAEPKVSVEPAPEPAPQVAEPEPQAELEASKPVPAPAVVETVFAPTRRTVTPEEEQTVASYFQNEAGIRITSLQTHNLLLVYTPLKIRQAIQHVAKVKQRQLERDVFVSEVEQVLARE